MSTGDILPSVEHDWLNCSRDKHNMQSDLLELAPQ